jgi:hypothetical protein
MNQDPASLSSTTRCMALYWASSMRYKLRPELRRTLVGRSSERRSTLVRYAQLTVDGGGALLGLRPFFVPLFTVVRGI